MVRREIILLEFIGGGFPLTPPERQEAAGIIQQELKDDRAKALELDAGASQVIGRLGKGDAAYDAAIRAGSRYNVFLNKTNVPAFASENAVEARIINAHDPAIISDPAHQHFINRKAAAAMVEANAKAAALFGVTAPGPDAVDTLSAALKPQYGTVDDGLKDMLAHAEENLPYALPFLPRASAQARNKLIAEYRPKIMADSNPALQQFRLAEVLSAAGRNGAKSGGGGNSAALASRLRTQNILQNQMLGASRSASPSCNVYTGTAQKNQKFCQPN